MKNLTTCRELYIEDYDGAYLNTLIRYIPDHISYMHIKFAKTFEGFEPQKKKDDTFLFKNRFL